MEKRLSHILLLLFFAITYAHAEVVVLRSGKTIKGEILLNNHEVIIIRQKDGSRYQYPQNEVVAIHPDTNTPNITKDDSVAISSRKIVALRTMAQIGTAHIPHVGWNADFQMNVAIGTQQLQNQDIFLGGSIGYHTVFSKDNMYAWIPIQMLIQWSIPIASDSPHRPMVATTLGYSFASKKQYKGGICTGVDIGWWYRINQQSSLTIALSTQWQQAQITIREVVHQTAYSNTIGCTISTISAKIGIQF